MQLFLLRAAGFLLPCYIMAWAISILQRRRQRQVSAVLKFMIFAPYLFMFQTLLFTNQQTKVDVIFAPYLFMSQTLLFATVGVTVTFVFISFSPFSGNMQQMQTDCYNILIISCFGNTGGCSIGGNPSCFRATIWAAQGTAICNNTSI